MKRLVKANTEVADYNLALYVDESAAEFKQEVITTIEDKIERVNADSNLKYYPEDGVEGEATGSSMLKWSDLEESFGTLTYMDKDAIADVVTNIDVLQTVFKDELQDVVEQAFVIEDINIEYENTAEGLVINYTSGEVRYDKNLDY